MKKILLIEDQKDISNNIKKFLEIHDYFVKQVFNWNDWLEEWIKEDFDLILLDIWLPKLNWFLVLEKILQKKEVPIIFITAKEYIEDKLFWLKLGAKDYIIKPFDLRELLARIEIHLTKSLNVKTKKVFKKENILIDFENLLFEVNNKIVNLQQKEVEILKLLIENEWNIVTRNEIIEKTWWEKALFNSDWKLDVHISNLRNKFWKDFIKTIKWFWYKI